MVVEVKKGQTRALTFGLVIIVFILLLMLISFLPFNQTEKTIAVMVSLIFFFVSFLLMITDIFV